MIEFIIPLNLPVRAIEATETNRLPSLRLQREIACLVEQLRFAGPVTQSLLDSAMESKTPSNHGTNVTSEIEQELVALRSQKALFASGVEALRKASDDSRNQVNGLLHQLQEAAVELADAIASKLIFEEIEKDRYPIANLVHEVISRLNTTSGAVIRMHPQDLAMLDGYSVIDATDTDSPLKFVADSTLARGDCKAKAGEISVVYELRRQINEIRRELLSRVSGHAEA